MMLLLCSSNGLPTALTSTVHIIVVISTCSTQECGPQLTEKMKRRSVVCRHADLNLCKSECIEDSFIFASCRRTSEKSKKLKETSRPGLHPEAHPSDRIESCGSEVCSDTSKCVNEGCKKVCMKAPPLCDLHTASKTGDQSRVNLLLSKGQTDVNCQEWIGRTPVMWATGEGHREVVELLFSKGANMSLVDRFGINILHLACLGGDVEVVTYVLSQNILNINGTVQCGRTAVMLAAENGHKGVVELLVDKYADVSFVDKTGDNILHCACRGGDAEVVKYILSKKMVDINSPGHRKKTPVMVAGEEGHKEIVEILVKHGADLSLNEESGSNILYNACYRGQFDVVKYILSLKSVDVNCRGYKKRTPVMAAADQGHKDLVELLVQNEANLSLRDKEGTDILYLASLKGHVDVVKYLLSLSSVDINSRGRNMRTPVMAAAGQGHKNVVELFVKHGADLSLSQKSGNNILHNACYCGQFEVVKYVLSLNSVNINSRGKKKRTPVMVAAAEGHKDVVELLVNHGADLSLRETLRSNILHIACKRGQFDVVKYILSLNSVDINSRGWKKRTPVMAAAERGHRKVVELLVEHGANLLLRTQSGNTILHIACNHGRVSVVKQILSLTSVDINCRGWKKRTPVMVAADQGHKGVVELLVKNQANLSLTDVDGKNSLDLARQGGHLDVMRYVMSL